jgi:hypothetical protein
VAPRRAGAQFTAPLAICTLSPVGIMDNRRRGSAIREISSTKWRTGGGGLIIADDVGDGFCV